MTRNEADQTEYLSLLVGTIAQSLDQTISARQAYEAVVEALAKGPKVQDQIRIALRCLGISLRPISVVDGRQGARWPLLVIENNQARLATQVSELPKVAANDNAPGQHILLFVPGSSLPLESLKEQTHVGQLMVLLRWERRDIGIVIGLAAAVGFLSLATPIAVQTVFDVLAFGTLIQPLVVISVLLMAALGVSGMLRLLESWAVEIIARRIFVRTATDFAHRLPMIDTQQCGTDRLQQKTSRFLDVALVDKTASVLLFEGSTAGLQIFLGLILLAFYHPFLLAFDAVLVIGMAVVVLALGRGGIKTAVLESKHKYQIVDWLQEMARSPRTFRTTHGLAYSERQTDALLSDWLRARKSQFHIHLRQYAGVIGLQVVATGGLLLIGGALVVAGQLSFGQLVAAEVVMTATVASLAKVGRLFTKAYDLFASLGKLAEVVELEVVKPGALMSRKTTQSIVLNAEEIAGSRVAITDTRLEPFIDMLSLDGRPCSRLDPVDWANRVSVLDLRGVFTGSVIDNLRLECPSLERDSAEKILNHCGLKLDLDDDVGTHGSSLSMEQRARLLLARHIASSKLILVMDLLLDRLAVDVAEQCSRLVERSTIVCLTQREDIAACFDRTMKLNSMEHAV